MSATIGSLPFAAPRVELDALLPDWSRSLGDLQTAIPQLAKNGRRIAEIDSILQEVPTAHRSVRGDARLLDGLPDESVHLVVTSPPYWNLKEYRDSDGQLGHTEPDRDLSFQQLVASLAGRVAAHLS